MMEKSMEWRNFASLNSLLYPNTVIFFVPDFGNVEAPLFDTQKEGRHWHCVILRGKVWENREH